MISAFKELLTIIYGWLRYEINIGDATFTIMGVAIAICVLNLICWFLGKIISSLSGLDD